MSEKKTPARRPAETPMWSVIDKNARAAPRVHEMLDGTSYALKAAERTPMPQAHAMLFLRDDSFRVFDADGVEQVSLPKVENVDARNKRASLEPGEVVAKLAELTTTALAARCAIRPGGRAIVAAGDRDAMVDFLLNAPAVADLPVHERLRHTEDDGLGGEALPSSATAAALKDKLDAVMAGEDPLAMGA